MVKQSVSDASKNLYHYTTWRGLFGILESGKIWATDYRFLNDAGEFYSFRDELEEVLLRSAFEQARIWLLKCSNFSDASCLEKVAAVIAKVESSRLSKIMYNLTVRNAYIASFCGESAVPYINEHGLLSQWRGYGKDGGYALVFDTKELEERCREYEEYFGEISCFAGDAVYSGDSETIRRELGPDLAEIEGFARRLFEAMQNGAEEPPDSRDAHGALAKCMARYKHRGFSEEKEVRIVVFTSRHLRSGDSSPAGKSEIEPRLRDVDGRQTPYIELFANQSSPLPIRRIIVGPHRDKEARAAALRVKLRKTDIEITVSETPFI